MSTIIFFLLILFRKVLVVACVKTCECLAHIVYIFSLKKKEDKSGPAVLSDFHIGLPDSEEVSNVRFGENTSDSYPDSVPSADRRLPV